MNELETNLYIGSLRSMSLEDLLEEFTQLFRDLYLYQHSPIETLSYEMKIAFVKIEILKYVDPNYKVKEK